MWNMLERANPSLYEFEGDRFWSCAKNGANPSYKGNYLQYRIDPTGRTMDLEMVYAEYCKPKPEACHSDIQLQ